MSYLGHLPAARAFDSLADQYDEIFTCTPVGRAQRDQVWNVADRLFQPGMDVLELNCGTGEDAIHFAQRGIRVTGTDASRRMIARARFRSVGMGLPLSFVRLPIELLTALRPQTFDAVFSNFSGLNCVADLRQVARALRFLLQPGASGLLCLSTRFCLWESVWFAAQGDMRKARRRWAGHTLADINDAKVEVFYPTVHELRMALSPWFRICRTTGIGITVPPSYVNRHFGGAKALMLLSRVDSVIGRLPLLRTIGDHMLVAIERTPA
jgi:ubiquinone/menaquinone biosynthesis C-methylase UbiE